ncbi:MAG: VWA domain-containing protein [Acidobacteria bacterium]|nr:VWA domain-containing protein [Acidobacteriota bacterium]
MFETIFLFGQSNRVPNYSENSSEPNKGDSQKKSPENQTTEINTKINERKLDDEIIRVETDLVVIPTSISERNGKRVANISKEEFKIFENGIEQEIAYFSNEEQPFTVALVLDMSYSSVFKLKDIQDAALVFISQLRPDDKVLVISFDEKVQVLCEPTNNRKILRLAIEGTKIASGTSFFSALDLVLNEKLNEIAGRKAIVVLSDGVDTTSQNSTALRILNDVSETDVLVYPVQYDTYDDVQKSRKESAQIFYDENDRPRAIEKPRTRGEREDDYKNAGEFLKEVSNQSGGRVYRVSSSSKLTQAFANIADELRKIYSLGYYPNVERKAGAKYTVKVRVYRPNLIVHAKNNYLWKQNRKTLPKN